MMVMMRRYTDTPPRISTNGAFRLLLTGGMKVGDRDYRDVYTTVKVRPLTETEITALATTPHMEYFMRY